MPEPFNTWSGLSIVAGALERKVWLPWNDTLQFYPNIYVLLVSLPGIGKSTALTNATKLLMEMNQKEMRIHFMPNQASEAKLIELMGAGVSFEIGSRIFNQNVAYFAASEASNSFKPVYGDIVPCLTEFYDCPTHWAKATKKDGLLTLENVSMNLLAGCTFDYLGRLVTDENIMGGFASRLIYVVHRDKMERDQKFQMGGRNETEMLERATFRRMLIEDLAQIHKLVGPFTADRAFGEAWEAWYGPFERERQAQASEKMQSLLVRVNTNIFKVAMLMSAAESNDMKLKLHHWEKASKLVLENSEGLSLLFRETKAANIRAPNSLMNALFLAYTKKPEWGRAELSSYLTMMGQDHRAINGVIQTLIDGKQLVITSVSAGETKMRLTANPDDYI